MTVFTRAYQTSDLQAIVRMNHKSEHLLSPMDRNRFIELQTKSSLLLVVEVDQQTAGFLIAFCDGTDYDSVNYRWFSRRLKNFLYIDRVVVSEHVRSMGIGRQLYREAETWARTQEILWMAAEIDLQPPNHASLKFHDKLGFVEAGQQTAGDDHKLVSLRILAL